MKEKAKLTWWSAIFILIVGIAIDVFSRIAVHILMSWIAGGFAIILFSQGLLLYYFRTIKIESKFDNLIINFCIYFSIAIPILFFSKIILNRFFGIRLSILQYIFEQFFSYGLYLVLGIQVLLGIIILKNYLLKIMNK